MPLAISPLLPNAYAVAIHWVARTSRLPNPFEDSQSAFFVHQRSGVVTGFASLNNIQLHFHLGVFVQWN